MCFLFCTFVSALVWSKLKINSNARFTIDKYGIITWIVCFSAFSAVPMQPKNWRETRFLSCSDILRICPLWKRIIYDISTPKLVKWSMMAFFASYIMCCRKKSFYYVFSSLKTEVKCNWKLNKIEILMFWKLFAVHFMGHKRYQASWTCRCKDTWHFS